MSYLLRIDASASGATSISRQVADSFAAAWSGDVVRRDLALDPVGHLGAAGITARTTPAGEHTPEQRAAALLQDELIEEFLGADAYLFAVPLYNYSIPSVFKAWLDHTMVVGRTIGLGRPAPSAGRPAVVVSARGGGYGPGTPQHGKDFLVPALETILGDPILMALDVRTITPELTYARTMDALRHLLPQHHASLEDAHTQARRQAEEVASITADPTIA
ncbi:FMN-dependent NADH-azoreductase [Streptomyces sp. SID8361]|uniref:FMN-dependent NADH-azoreductase n=1 Tax=Streptomyces sp. MnatMP-M27 TaxID=1839768 RepID=UPI00081EDF73|nr:NAD(P)H-dependent oxidoreductase [Streptomyces sp. MnatMP-M27]MYU12211.1 FMN-dependent NADH-azoreductase [Streptomyces sp. SID8361]SCF89315.1 FMN-dependent NADH-azoreductase [Streptomyces sp. MnatMP-M27]